MRVNPNQQVSVLASATGLLLIAFYALARFAGTQTDGWLINVVACIAGFELFMFGQERWEAFKRRRGGGRG